MVKSAVSSSREPGFHFQEPHDSSQVGVTPVLGDPTHQACMVCTYACRQNIHKLKILLPLPSYWVCATPAKFMNLDKGLFLLQQQFLLTLAQSEQNLPNHFLDTGEGPHLGAGPRGQTEATDASKVFASWASQMSFLWPVLHLWSPAKSCGEKTTED